jgi:DNA polymerase-3 subunit gamma/tau
MTDASPDMTAPPAAADTPDYRVLARAYRPGTFGELIGQDAMVRTLKNAIESGRLAHAFILTGVRGIGKTTTARLIAKALNCDAGPTVEPCGHCPACIAIAESRHVDVLEMDAASRTGVDDIREIIDGVRYGPVEARYKVYIIDEVHMLSRNAFNALLKTLEEPPEHVKFIFATTEIRKVPVTVLSRCQRFDLRRIETSVLVDHFAAIARREEAEIAPEALRLIARAADGSVRDGLSLLDQAIAHGAGAVSEGQVRDMLGLADRTAVFDLFDALMKGDIAGALDNGRGQYNAGADPVVILQDLLELTHWITRLKAAPDAGEDVTVPEAERARGAAMAQKLSMPVLTRAWQMLLKGLEEVRLAPAPLAALEMVMVRLAYAADLPDPATLLGQLEKPGGPAAPGAPGAPNAPTATPNKAPPPPPSAGPVSAAAPAPREAPAPQGPGDGPQSYHALVELAGHKGEILLQTYLTENVHLVRFAPGRLEIRLGPHAPLDLPHTLGDKLRDWTGARWVVALSQEDGEPTLGEQRRAHEAEARSSAMDEPLVRAVLERFPGAKISAVHEHAPDNRTGAPDDDHGEDM